MKYKVGDLVGIYENTPTFKDGAVCQVIDRDPNDKSYAVATLQEIGINNRDVQKLVKHSVKWTKKEDMFAIKLKRPMNIFKRLWMLILRKK